MTVVGNRHPAGQNRHISNSIWPWPQPDYFDSGWFWNRLVMTARVTHSHFVFCDFAFKIKVWECFCNVLFWNELSSLINYVIWKVRKDIQKSPWIARHNSNLAVMKCVVWKNSELTVKRLHIMWGLSTNMWTQNANSASFLSKRVILSKRNK